MNLCAGEMICAEEIKDEVGIKELVKGRLI